MDYIGVQPATSVCGAENIVRVIAAPIMQQVRS